jgi:hypothetical protein
MIREHLLGKGFTDNYSIWTKIVKQERMHKATTLNRKGRKLAMMILLTCSLTVMVVKALM